MKTSAILKLMKIMSWIIFIGICIKAGAILMAFIVSLNGNPEATKDLYLGINLSSIYILNSIYYIVFVILMVLLLTTQALIFLLVTKLFYKFDEQFPFTKSVSNLLSKISYVALSAGFIALVGAGFSKWLTTQQGIVVNFDWSAQEFLLMAGVIFIIGLFYKRGIELQAENDLTI